MSTEQLQAVLESAEETIFKAFDKDVPSSYIGDVVAERLREIDKIAYVRFASVYRDFADVGDLINEAQEVRHDLIIGPEQKDLFGEE
jgi:transcriptional repressor NrdR